MAQTVKRTLDVIRIFYSTDRLCIFVFVKVDKEEFKTFSVMSEDNWAQETKIN